MAQSSLRQFYTVRKRPHEEHGSLKRRKLTEDTRLDIPTLEKDADPQSLPFTQPTIVTTNTTSTSSCNKASRTSTKRSSKAKTTRGRGRNAQSQRSRKSSPPKATTVLPFSSSSNTTTSSSSSSSATKDVLFSDILTQLPASTPSNPTIITEGTISTLNGSIPSSTDTNTPSSSSIPTSATPSSSSSNIITVDSSSSIGATLPSKTRVLKSKRCVSEDPLFLVPSSPKSPKHDTSSLVDPQNPVDGGDSSSTFTLPPPRSRKNLAERMKLASADPLPPSSSSSSFSIGVSTPAQQEEAIGVPSNLTARELAKKTTVEVSSTSQTRARRAVAGSKPSARELAEKTPTERRLERLKDLVRPVSKSGSHSHSSRTSAQSTASSEMVSHLYKLSARELAQRTEPERRRVSAVRARHREKSPLPSSSHTPQLHQFNSFVVESPTKSPAQSPSKQPAYQRFHSLAQKPGETPDLPLPYKYQVLLEKFRCTDTVVTMLQKRREICTFNKLKQAVEEMTRRKYENRNLGQMETVYPRAFIFRQEKNIPGVYDRKTYESYQLTVECNISEDGRTEREKEAEEEKEKKNVFLDSSALLRRRRVFNKNLCTITRQHHKEFLSSLNPPLDIPDDKVLRWHPAFQLDTVPEIVETELPKPPTTEIYTTARDVLVAAQGRLAPRVQQALEGVAKSSSEVKGVEPAVRKAESGGRSSDVALDPALRGVSQKLLEKIQKKEASRVQSDITRDPVKEKRLEMLTRLPQLTRILRSLFVTEKKAAIPWDSVVQKLRDSHSSCLPPDGVEEHLELMKDTLGGWLTVVEVRKRKFVKINKSTDSQVLSSRMEDTRRTLLAS